MKAQPLISLVVPSFNQGRFIAETLQSLVDQQYPNLEVIIQDGGSTDGAVEVAREFVRRHPGVFQLFVEKDAGQADALNRGFARATGTILGFLNSDDTLYQGCLQRVAREIDPARGRYVVFGRCLFTGEGSGYVGVEHPAVYRSHFDQLAIWKRGYNTLPQPSVFWHRRVWEKCGGFNVKERHVLDYDLFCRFSAKFRFHFVDELWSTYRMHPASKSSLSTEADILDMSIAVSRRHWGGWWQPLRWRCTISHRLHNRHLHEHARHYAHQAEAAAREKRRFRALAKLLQTAAYSPRMARDRLLRGWLAGYKLTLLEHLFGAEEGFTGHYGDGWIGPVYRTTLPLPAGAHEIAFELKHLPIGHHQVVHCVLKINGRKQDQAIVTTETDFTLTAAIPPLHKSSCAVEILTDKFFIPRDVHNIPDDRRLSVVLRNTKVTRSS